MRPYRRSSDSFLIKLNEFAEKTLNDENFRKVNKLQNKTKRALSIKNEIRKEFKIRRGEVSEFGVILDELELIRMELNEIIGIIKR